VDKLEIRRSAIYANRLSVILCDPFLLIYRFLKMLYQGRLRKESYVFEVSQLPRIMHMADKVDI